jgi:putative membrane protein
MVIDGLMFWWLVLDSRPAPPARLSPGRRILVVIAAIPPQILLGAFIFFSTHELYPVYSICGRAFTWLSPMRDQQIGGLLLWIPGSMMSVIGALIALRHWIRLSARGRLRNERAGGRPAGAATFGLPVYHVERIQICGMPSSSCTSDTGSKPYAP